MAQSAWVPPVASRQRLPNGLTLVLDPQHYSPVVALVAMVRAGSANDPDSLSGLANLTAGMLSRGSRNYTAEQIAQQIDFTGAELSVECDYDATYISLSVLSRHLDVVLPVFLDLLQHPAFDSTELRLLRQETLSGIRLQQDRPDQVSQLAFFDLLYGSHPYHRPVEGSEETLLRIAPSDLRRFYQTYYGPNNVAIAVVGDVRSGGISSFLKRETKGWPLASPTSPSLAAVSLPSKPRAVIIHRPISQAYINLGFLGPQRNDADYQAVRIMNYILGGGGFVSRLTKSIRIQQGLAYDVDAFFEPRSGQGPYQVSLQTKVASADTAIKTALAEMRKLRDLPVDSGELVEARNFILGSYPFRFETYGQAARQLLILELHGLDAGYFRHDLDLTGRVDAADVKRAALRLLRPDNYVLAIVADTSQLELSIPELKFQKQ